MNKLLNKKGFTLIEILMVIVLISLLFGLGVAGIMKLSENISKRSLESKISMIERSAQVWGTNNKTLLKSHKCVIEGVNYDCYKISVNDLIVDDYLTSDEIGEIVYNNPVNNESMLNNCVYIYKKNNRVYSFYEESDNTCKDKLPTENLPELEDNTLLLADAIINNAKNASSGTNSTIYSLNSLTNPAEVVSGASERTLSEEPDDYTATTGNNSYYFRGNVLDNYVDFAGMCWRVVRIEGDGSIKLILEDQDELCATSNGNFDIGKGNFGYTKYAAGELSNSTSTATNTSTKYVMDYLSGETNTSSSMATAFKNYQTTLNTKIGETYTGETINTMLKSGNWCLDDRGYSRSGSSGSYTYAELTTNQMLDYKVANTTIYYGAYTRLMSGNRDGYNPTLKCNVEPMTAFADSTLMYVGTLTADELTYAGATSNSSNENFYLMNEYTTTNYVFWWAFSPRTFNSAYVYAFILDYYGDLNYSGVIGHSSFRPAVSLKSGAEIAPGGDGTKTNAYVISVS